MTDARPYHYRMACGHHGHRLSAKGRPYCAVCVHDKPVEARQIVGTADEEARRNKAVAVDTRVDDDQGRLKL